MPRGTARDAEAAVAAAHEAFSNGPWSRMTPADRGLLLYRLADCMAADAEHLADLEVRDTGKLKAEMLGNLRYLPRWYQYYGGLADKVEGSVTPIDKPGMLHYVVYEPLGVVTCIVPWNSPLLLTTMKLAAALAAGNTVVIKPSEFASVSLIAFARLFEKAGFPPGVVNVVTGYGKEVGEVLTTHPLVKRIAFTGGDAGGKAVAAAAAQSFKRISLELGGKSPNIVFADANRPRRSRAWCPESSPPPGRPAWPGPASWSTPPSTTSSSASSSSSSPLRALGTRPSPTRTWDRSRTVRSSTGSCDTSRLPKARARNA